MKLSDALIQELTDAMINAEEDLISGESANDDCEDDDRRRVEVFGIVLASPTIETIRQHPYAVEFVADMLEDTAIGAQFFGKGDAPYDHHVAILKDYRRISK
jgi:hypothetical protein